MVDIAVNIDMTGRVYSGTGVVVTTEGWVVPRFVSTIFHQTPSIEFPFLLKDVVFDEYGAVDSVKEIHTMASTTKRAEVLKRLRDTGIEIHKENDDVIDTLDTESEPTHEEHDAVHHPSHYELPSGKELKDMYVDLFGIDGARIIFQGNVLKYLIRYREKNGFQDLQKIKEYTGMLEGLDYPEQAKNNED